MIALFLIGAVSLISFALFIALLVGIIPSFSDAYYELQKKKSWYKFLFQLCLGVTAVSLLPVMLQISPDWCQFLAFFTAGPIGFVAVAPRFRIANNGVPEYDQERKVHMNAAKLSAVASVLWVLCMSYATSPFLLLVFPVFGLLGYIGYIFAPYKIWWAEMACFGWTLATIAILLF